ncbi:MAG: 4Fe-4S dicluster domain-containing protein [Calditrichaeota bacterium]|nr:MAG: 4Fe-4S dicluster domain-containing protein [Calditrichota bacterium]
MAHHTLKSDYQKLTDRLNRFPQGAPPSDLLYRILSVLFSGREAELVAQLPIKPFTAAKAAKIWKMNQDEARKILDTLAGRALLLDIEKDGQTIYTLPPPMAGFFEFSMMRLRDDVDQKLLAELFYQYLNEQDDFIRALFTNGETQLGRAFVHEPAVAVDQDLCVMDYERASEVIKTASHRGVGICYCRHKMEHMNRACSAPMEICMTFNGVAASLISHGYAREVEVSEGLDLLQLAYENRLVQFGENVREGISFICNCCGCCCEALIAQRRFSVMHPIHTTNFLPEISPENCNGCAKCVRVCPVEAISMVSANNPHNPKQQKAKLNEDICLGCGICVRECDQNVLRLVQRPERVITPLNSVHRAVVMALERDKLQNLIFDNRALWSHRMMAAFLGAILKLPPVKRVLATKQVKSRYLEYLITHVPA